MLTKHRNSAFHIHSLNSSDNTTKWETISPKESPASFWSLPIILNHSHHSGASRPAPVRRLGQSLSHCSSPSHTWQLHSFLSSALIILKLWPPDTLRQTDYHKSDSSTDTHSINVDLRCFMWGPESSSEVEVGLNKREWGYRRGGLWWVSKCICGCQ